MQQSLLTYMVLLPMRSGPQIDAPHQLNVLLTLKYKPTKPYSDCLKPESESANKGQMQCLWWSKTPDFRSFRPPCLSVNYHSESMLVPDSSSTRSFIFILFLSIRGASKNDWPPLGKLHSASPEIESGELCVNFLKGAPLRLILQSTEMHSCLCLAHIP